MKRLCAALRTSARLHKSDPSYPSKVLTRWNPRRRSLCALPNDDLPAPAFERPVSASDPSTHSESFLSLLSAVCRHGVAPSALLRLLKQYPGLAPASHPDALIMVFLYVSSNVYRFSSEDEGVRGDMKEILSTVRGMLSGLPVIVSGPKLSDAITVAVLDLIQSGHADLAVQLILDCPKRVSTLALFDSSVLSLCRPFSNPCWSSLRSPAEVRPLLQHATTVFHRACALGHLLTPTSLHTFGAAVCMHTPDLFLSAWPAFRLVFDFGGGRLKSPLTTTVADAAMLSFAMAASKAVGKTRDALTHFAMLRDRLADDSVSSVDRSVVSAVVWCLLFTGRPVPSLAFDFWRLVESRTVLAVGDGDMLGQLGVSLLQIGDRPSLRSLIMNHTPAHLLLSVAEAAMPSTPVARACHVRLADALLRSSVTVDRIPLSSLVPILVRLGNVYLTGVLQRLAHSLAIEDWLFAQEVAQVALESPRLNPGQSGLLAIMSSSHVDWNSNAFLPFLEFVQALHRMVPGHEYMELVVAMYDSMSVRAIPTTARSQSLCKFTQSFTDAGLPVPLPSLLLVVDTCLLAKDYEDAVWAWIRLLSTKTGDAILSQSHSEQLACLFLDSGSLSATQPVDALRSHVDTIVFVVTAAQSLPRLSLSEETLRRIVNAVETLGDTCVGKWWKEARLLRLRCPSPTP